MKHNTKIILLAILTILIEICFQISLIKFYINPKLESTDLYIPSIVSVSILFVLIYSGTSTFYGNKIR